MLDIKFRAKNIDTGEWVYGYYVKHQEFTPAAFGVTQTELDASYKHFIFSDGFSDWNMKKPWYKTDIEPNTLGRFTGLHDENGAEIYEGDLVKCAHGNCIVEFGKWVSNNKSNDDILGWLLMGEYSAHAFDPQIAYKVISNIHDNPELLTKYNIINP